jgi:predicted RNA methylase
LASDLVPGTTAEQRTRLAMAGGLVGSLVPHKDLRQWPNALQAWVDAAPKPPRRVVDDVRQSLAQQPDVFATLYCELVSGENRRRLGTFFTPQPIVEFMLDKIHLPRDRGTFVDPGAGVGAFALAAATRWPRIDVVAVDVNVVTLGFLGAAASHAGVANIRLVHDDYLAWLRHDDRRRDPQRLLVGNPPYTRHQELDRKLKKTMVDATGELVTSGLAGLSAYFLAVSFNATRPDDAMCFVLPSTWSEARYGRELRAWLWQETHRRVEMHLFPADASIFSGTRVSPMVLYVGPRRNAREAFTRHRATLADRIVTTTAGQRASRAEGVPPSLGPWLWRHSDHSPGEWVPLSDLGRVRRGVATGANAFFFLTDVEADELPEGAVRPALRRLRHVAGDVLDAAEHRRIGAQGKPRWLLMLDNDAVIATRAVQLLLARGQRAGIPDRYLATVRDPWYLVEDIPPPHLLVAIMTKERLRVVRNVARVTHSNSMYGVYLKKPSLAKPLAAWLNSDEGQRSMLTMTRHYSEGLRKLEPRDLTAVLVPTAVVLASR